MMIRPNTRPTPTAPSAPSYCASATMAPQPAKTSANAANASAADRRQRLMPLLTSARSAWRSCREQQLLGELARQAGLAHLRRHGVGVVPDALDRDLELARAAVQDGEGAARVAVLGLADRAAVDEQHAAV